MNENVENDLHGQDIEYKEIAKYRMGIHRSKGDSDHLLLLLPVGNIILERQHLESENGT